MAKTLDEAGVKRLIQEIKGANKNLNTPIPISTENTPESKAQNVTNIADYVEKAKAAGIANVNGMAVTCLIDNDYSGVGYFYMVEGTFASILGVKSVDDTSEHYVFNLDSSGSYAENLVLTATSSNVVTSDMLVQGARKPIIITGDMTEVDEETYQKLLSDDVDVIANFGEGTFIESQAKYNTGDTLNLVFGYSQFDESAQGIIATYTISINTSAPHTLTSLIGACQPVTKDTLTPVLQEIDLTGTDADRKAKLDQFEADWKALTGADDLEGARFVGKLDINQMYVGCIFAYNSRGFFDGISLFNEENYQNFRVSIYTETGSLTITPLFSHLEAITIRTGNTPDDKAANVAAIKAYVDNLISLGVDTTKGYMIPIRTSSEENTVGFIIPNMTDTGYVGLGEIGNGNGINLYISNEGNVSMYRLQEKSDDDLTTTSNSIVGAINEVNATSVTNRADLDRTMSRVTSPDDRALPLLCGQPPILFGAGTPKEAIVPDNWNQYDPETGEGYNWNGKPSAIGQQYVDTTAASGGRYIAARDGEWDLKWINC